jgi:hypothetical protein
MTKNEIISLLEAEGLSPNKTLGQNFLTGTGTVSGKLYFASTTNEKDDIA